MQHGVLFVGALIILGLSQLSHLPVSGALGLWLAELWLLTAVSFLALLLTSSRCGISLSCVKALHRAQCITRAAWLLRLFIAGLFLVSLTALTLSRHAQLLNQQWPNALEGDSVWLSGQVVGVPNFQPLQERTWGNRYSGRWQFDFRMADMDLPKAIKDTWPWQGEKIRLSWYVSEQDAKMIRPGKWLCLQAKLKRPRGLVNFSGFDFQLYLLRQGIVAKGYIKHFARSSECLPAQEEGLVQTLGQQLDLWRWQLKNTFGRWRQNWQSYDLLLALSLGDKSALETERWQQLKQFGLNHLLAISGLHIGLAAALGFWLGRLLAGGLLLLRPTSKLIEIFPVVTALALAIFYACLSGLAIPAQRALIMVLLVLLACLCQWRISYLAGLNVAFLSVLLIDPLAGYDRGFWLSFMAVAALLGLLRGRVSWQKTDKTSWHGGFISRQRLFWSGLWDCQKLLFIALAPLLLIYFGSIYPAALVTNLLMVPVVSLLAVPVILLSLGCLSVGAEALAVKLLTGVDQLLTLCWHWLEPAELIPSISGPQVQGFWEQWLLALLLSGGVLIGWLSVLPRALKLLSFSMVVLLFGGLGLKSVNTTALKQSDTESSLGGGLTLRFYDVGQGLAVLVERPGYHLLYDAGPKFGPRFNAGHIIVEDLAKRGIKLNALVLSHPDGDHIGGAASVMAYQHSAIKTLPIGFAKKFWQELGQASSNTEMTVFYDTAMAHPRLFSEGSEHSQPAHHSDCHRASRWQAAGVAFEFLPVQESGALTRNFRSCVLLIRWQGHKILLTGDIDRARERQLLAHYGDALEQVTLMSVPHHGSKTSSSDAFLDTLTPQWALVSAGYNNRYRHPNNAVVNRYLKRNITLLNTANQGAIDVYFQGAGPVSISSARTQERRFWFD